MSLRLSRVGSQLGVAPVPGYTHTQPGRFTECKAVSLWAYRAYSEVRKHNIVRLAGWYMGVAPVPGYTHTQPGRFTKCKAVSLWAYRAYSEVRKHNIVVSAIT
ncbi:hypothetical protein J6590_045827 [Homalodisca vitripennis]|nr:hypothetical protein J6590_045827 [Homalodisca vitripennis]